MRKHKGDLPTAKARLYRLLLEKPHDELTPTEIELGYWLSQDQDIQGFLEAARGLDTEPRIREH